MVALAEQKAADDGADQADGEIVEDAAATAENLCGEPAGDKADDDPGIDTPMASVGTRFRRICDHAVFGGMRWFGVELEIFNSSSFMSAPMSPNSGVDR